MLYDLTYDQFPVISSSISFQMNKERNLTCILCFQNEKRPIRVLLLLYLASEILAH